MIIKPRAVRTTVGGVLLTCAVVLGLLDGHGQQRSASGAPTAQRYSPTAEAGAEQGGAAVTVAPHSPAPPAEPLSPAERKRLIDRILGMRVLERRAAQHVRHGREYLLAAESHRDQYEKLSDEELRRCAAVAQQERQVSTGGLNTGRLLNEAMLAAGCPGLR